MDERTGRSAPIERGDAARRNGARRRPALPGLLMAALVTAVVGAGLVW